MNNDDAGRKCKVDHKIYGNKPCTFKFVDNDIVYGSDNEPIGRAMAFIECDETGAIFKVLPEQITFIKK